MSDELYHGIINSLNEGFCIIDVIFDGAGLPVDWRYLEANPQYRYQGGSHEDVGQLVSARYPEAEPFWFDFYGKVAVTGIPEHVERRLPAGNKWIDVYAFKIGGEESRKVGVLFRDSTDRKRREEDMLRNAEEVRKNEAEMLELIDGFTEGSWIVDRTAGIVQCSEKWAKRIGLDRIPENDRLRYTHTLVYPPDQQGGNSIEHCIETGMTRFDLEYRVKTVDSGYIWTQNRGKIVYDECGTATKVYAATIDITERKKTEEALRQSDRNFSALFNRKTVGLSYCRTIFDEHTDAVDFVVLDVNPTFERMVGIPRNQIVGKKVTKTNPGISRHIIDRHNRVAVTGEETSWSFYDHTKDCWYDVNVFCPQKGYFISIFNNITERKRAEKALRESEAEKLKAIAAERQRFYNVLEILPVMICLITPDYRIPFANKAFRKNYGEANGRHCYDYCCGRSEPCPSCESLLPLISGRPHHWVITSPDGSKIIDVHDYPFQDVDGTTLILEIGFDVTERRRAGDALRESEQKARTLVAELEEADRNKNQFLGVLSHELRNPLAVIVASLSLLEIAGSPEQISMAKESINRQVGQLTKLVDDLLDLARISQNKIKLKNEKVNLCELLKNAARDMVPGYRKKGVRLNVKLPKEPLFLNADPVRIAQCAGNLLQNAMKFTPAHGKVTLTLENLNEEAVIRVLDDGVGIDPGLLEHIFKPFAQADTSLDRTNSGGLGLGLSVVDGIVRLHGGSVTAFSEGEGKGALFTMKLPDMDQPVDAPGAAAVKKQARYFKILIVDDNKALTDILCAMLSSMGHQAAAAHNGFDGITAAKKIRPDVIFCDIGLPGRSGYEVAGTLKADNELKNAYLVALTGYAGEEDKERAKAAGFDRHLAKPVDMAALKKVLAEIPCAQSDQ